MARDGREQRRRRRGRGRRPARDGAGDVVMVESNAPAFPTVAVVMVRGPGMVESNAPAAGLVESRGPGREQRPGRDGPRRGPGDGRVQTPTRGRGDGNAPAVMVRGRDRQQRSGLVEVLSIVCRRRDVARDGREQRPGRRRGRGRRPARDGAAIASNAPAWSRSSRSSAGDVTWPVMVESNAPAGDVAVDGDPLVMAPRPW